MKSIATSAPPIALQNGVITNLDICSAIDSVNQTLTTASHPIGGITLELFDIIDLRMLSGLIGEMFVASLSTKCPFLKKNPNIDGYPDLLDLSSSAAALAFPSLQPEAFISFPFGGLEVKNTFGTKKTGANISHRGTRISQIQSHLVWKAHHRQTNNLVALQSDYVSGVPQIVAAFFSNELNENDWTVKQNPKEGSTMTSFCQTQKTAFNKLKPGLRAYVPNIGFEKFIGFTA